MTKRHMVVATRESPLAVKQAEEVQNLLQTHHPHLSVELLTISTFADKTPTMSLLEMGGKGIFVKELEEALLNKKADIAVHSMKDVPMDLPEGLTIAAMLAREDARDVWVSTRHQTLAELPAGGIVGTSSLRRQIQLRILRSDLALTNLRGNVNTRLNRLDQGDFDGIVLAAAGLKRMQLSQRIRAYFPFQQLLPPAGQGALGIECRNDDEVTLAFLKELNHNSTFACVNAERAVCRKLEVGCMVPIGVYAEHHSRDPENIKLHAWIANQNGTQVLQSKHDGNIRQAENIGLRVAEELLQKGAAKILKEYR